MADSFLGLFSVVEGNGGPRSDSLFHAGLGGDLLGSGCLGGTWARRHLIKALDDVGTLVVQCFSVTLGMRLVQCVFAEIGLDPEVDDD